MSRIGSKEIIALQRLLLAGQTKVAEAQRMLDQSQRELLSAERSFSAVSAALMDLASKVPKASVRRDNTALSPVTRVFEYLQEQFATNSAQVLPETPEAVRPLRPPRRGQANPSPSEHSSTNGDVAPRVISRRNGPDARRRSRSMQRDQSKGLMNVEEEAEEEEEEEEIVIPQTPRYPTRRHPQVVESDDDSSMNLDGFSLPPAPRKRALLREIEEAEPALLEEEGVKTRRMRKEMEHEEEEQEKEKVCRMSTRQRSSNTRK